MVDLAGQDLGPADRPVQDGLVDDRPQARGVRPRQQALTAHPHADAFLGDRAAASVRPRVTIARA